MTRELELREQVANDLQVTEEVLDHLVTHLKLKLSQNCPDNTVLRLLKHDDYVKHLADNFLSELNK